MTTGFLFARPDAAVYRSFDLVVHLPLHLVAKDELLAALARRLAFPAHFGRNWDALADCLQDLSWRREHSILIAHQDLPLSQAEERRIYVDILRDAHASWVGAEEHSLAAAFPPQCRAAVEALLAAPGPDA